MDTNEHKLYWSTFDNNLERNAPKKYPFTNIIKTKWEGIDHTDPDWKFIHKGYEYRIVIAVAGFAAKNITIFKAPSTLTISGISGYVGNAHEYQGDIFLTRGLTGKDFRIQLPINQYTEIGDPTLKHGILEIKLKVSFPEDDNKYAQYIGVIETEN